MTERRELTSASDVARHTLDTELRALRRLLRRAAERAHEDVEHVHRLRVATRRTMETLRIYAPLLPDADVRWLGRQLKRIRRKADAARDCDVMDQRLSAEGTRGARTVRAIERRARRRAQRPIEELAPRMRRRLARRGKRMLEGMAAFNDVESHAAYAARVLAERAACFEASSKPDPYDLEALHRFRIDAKKLRYALERVGDDIGVMAVLKHLQQHLGDIHDHGVAIERMQRWALTENKRKRRAALVEEIALERRALRAASETYAAWWTPERRRTLVEGLRGRIVTRERHAAEEPCPVSSESEAQLAHPMQPPSS